MEPFEVPVCRRRRLMGSMPFGEELDISKHDVGSRRRVGRQGRGGWQPNA